MGCDVFYEGGSYADAVPADLRPYIYRMAAGIPFETHSFDAVVSNQVLEHVEDIDAALAEIARVLRPGGASLHIFPHREVWREGHCGIPFLHRFPRGSTPRVYYAAALRALGLGHFKSGKSVMQWSSEFCDWLDRWTHYRPLADLDAAFRRHFARIEYAESLWLAARTGRRLPATVARVISRKFAGVVIVAQR